ncbi:very short patch repair endonuclease [Methylovulum psychrotolerans]|jgi:DNA mismatch endonuclease (patch repair protein)|uniref:Very short patch repair endonuclease n=1 Tax=Methylovulum psychrotolerans TaxID=1704499 RepID=A0A2S5CGA4_9GAMM|nr:very short patch repair endonuclease [Methylovulum psychrotolerans]MBT9096583.1 DNA mismatch endonuclease Vsr [Methylovulum psychrotolerans]POZ49772.1 very short patch repair endonuclease [Methylovulum psychrotolerans]
MTDRISPEARSRTMAAIRSKNTRPEQWVRSALHRQGFRFRLHSKTLPGSPDLVLRKYHAVVFINGCFWHQHEGCKGGHIPATRAEFWAQKFARNTARDQKVLYQLKVLGWRAAIVWECGLKKRVREDTLRHLVAWLGSSAEYFEMPVYDEFSDL